MNDVQFRDYYETLGLKKGASEKEIRTAFRKLARQFHPDVNPGDHEAERRFKEVNEANEVLSDPEKRSLYDELGARWKDYEQYRAAGGKATPAEFVRGTTAGAGAGRAGQRYTYRTMSEDDLGDLFGSASPFSDFFNQTFGGGRRAAPTRGRDIEQRVEVTLQEAFSGTKRTLQYADAQGPRRIEATIPAGVHTGSRVRLAGQGGSGRNGGPSGDLFLIVEVASDPRFDVQGRDVYTHVRAPLYTMLLGGDVTVPTPKGGKVALRIPAPTQNARTFRLAGLGVPPARAKGKAGDLYVTVDVTLPTSLTDEERSLVERLAALRQT